MILSIIVAMSQNGVIGKDNQLPWHLSEDLKRFKAITMGHPILMGRKTYESIGRPLPGRTNLVLSKQGFKSEGLQVMGTLGQVLDLYPNEKEIFVIGGAQIYAQALPLADKIYLTRIEKEVEGDTFFPQVNWNDYQLIEETPVAFSEKEKIPYRFLTYLKN